MGIKDQFQDKARELADQAKSMPSKKDEASQRAARAKERGQESLDDAQREAEDRLDRDYDA
ncbi:hypothetical protein [Streptomyces showdoensis]|uniref:Uncharacterized protein n=1 Tax=Streptomyces showdoensis TaxID=68268 RepID=A0A2P2GSB6_STREW|nr:hypothetical protein [Streptomyces showdoensis]KKZ74392.1 hypothetical protein VO63_08125 [Streptomyces showdoensis]